MKRRWSKRGQRRNESPGEATGESLGPTGESDRHLENPPSNEDFLEGRPRKKAKEKVMDLLARRGHSELELRQKLSRTYEPHEVEDAIQFAKENNWMTAPEELAERVSLELGRKRKGHRYINQFLRNKGLPAVTKDADEEFEKALDFVQTKLGKRLGAQVSDELANEGKLDYEEQRKEQMKIYRMLGSRGFDDETIRRVLESVKAERRR